MNTHMLTQNTHMQAWNLLSNHFGAPSVLSQGSSADQRSSDVPNLTRCDKYSTHVSCVS